MVWFCLIFVGLQPSSSLRANGEPCYASESFADNVVSGKCDSPSGELHIQIGALKLFACEDDSCLCTACNSFDDPVTCPESCYNSPPFVTANAPPHMNHYCMMQQTEASCIPPCNWGVPSWGGDPTCSEPSSPDDWGVDDRGYTLPQLKPGISESRGLVGWTWRDVDPEYPIKLNSNALPLRWIETMGQYVPCGVVLSLAGSGGSGTLTQSQGAFSVALNKPLLLIACDVNSGDYSITTSHSQSTNREGVTTHYSNPPAYTFGNTTGTLHEGTMTLFRNAWGFEFELVDPQDFELAAPWTENMNDSILAIKRVHARENGVVVHTGSLKLADWFINHLDAALGNAVNPISLAGAQFSPLDNSGTDNTVPGLCANVIAALPNTIVLGGNTHLRWEKSVTSTAWLDAHSASVCKATVPALDPVARHLTITGGNIIDEDNTVVATLNHMRLDLVMQSLDIDISEGQIFLNDEGALEYDAGASNAPAITLNDSGNTALIPRSLKNITNLPSSIGLPNYNHDGTDCIPITSLTSIRLGAVTLTGNFTVNLKIGEHIGCADELEGDGLVITGGDVVAHQTHHNTPWVLGRINTLFLSNTGDAPKVSGTWQVPGNSSYSFSLWPGGPSIMLPTQANQSITLGTVLQNTGSYAITYSGTLNATLPNTVQGALIGDIDKLRLVSNNASRISFAWSVASGSMDALWLTADGPKSHGTFVHTPSALIQHIPDFSDKIDTGDAVLTAVGPRVSCVDVDMEMPYARAGPLGIGNDDTALLTIHLGDDDCDDTNNTQGIAVIHASAWTPEHPTDVQGPQRMGDLTLMIPFTPVGGVLASGSLTTSGEASITLLGHDMTPTSGSITFNIAANGFVWTPFTTLSSATLVWTPSNDPVAHLRVHMPENTPITIAMGDLTWDVASFTLGLHDDGNAKAHDAAVTLPSNNDDPFQFAHARIAWPEQALTVTRQHIATPCTDATLENDFSLSSMALPFVISVPQDTRHVIMQSPIGTACHANASTRYNVRVHGIDASILNLENVVMPFAALDMEIALHDEDWTVEAHMEPLADYGIALWNDAIAMDDGSIALDFSETWTAEGSLEGVWGAKASVLEISEGVALGLKLRAANNAPFARTEGSFNLTFDAVQFSATGPKLVHTQLVLSNTITAALAIPSAFDVPGIDVTFEGITLPCTDLIANASLDPISLAGLKIIDSQSRPLQLMLNPRGGSCLSNTAFSGDWNVNYDGLHLFGGHLALAALPDVTIANFGSISINAETSALSGHLPASVQGHAWQLLGLNMAIDQQSAPIAIAWTNGAWRMTGSWSGALNGFGFSLAFDATGPYLDFGVNGLNVTLAAFTLKIPRITLYPQGLRVPSLTLSWPNLASTYPGLANVFMPQGTPLTFSNIPITTSGFASNAFDTCIRIDHANALNVGMGNVHIRGTPSLWLDLSATRTCPGVSTAFLDGVLPANTTLAELRGIFLEANTLNASIDAADNTGAPISGGFVGSGNQFYSPTFYAMRIAPSVQRPLVWHAANNDADVNITTGNLDMAVSNLGLSFTGSNLQGTGHVNALHNTDAVPPVLNFSGIQFRFTVDDNPVTDFLADHITLAGGFGVVVGDFNARVNDVGVDFSTEHRLSGIPVSAQIQMVQGILLRDIVVDVPMPGAGSDGVLRFEDATAVALDNMGILRDPNNQGDNTPINNFIQGLFLPFHSPWNFSGTLRFSGISNANGKIAIAEISSLMGIDDGWVKLVEGEIEKGNVVGRLTMGSNSDRTARFTANLSYSGLLGSFLIENGDVAQNPCAPAEGAMAIALPGDMTLAAWGAMVLDLDSRNSVNGQAGSWRGIAFEHGAACLPSIFTTTNNTRVQLAAHNLSIGTSGLQGDLVYGNASPQPYEALNCDVFNGAAQFSQNSYSNAPIRIKLGDFDVRLSSFTASIDNYKLRGIRAIGGATVDPWIERLPFMLNYQPGSEKFDVDFCFDPEAPLPAIAGIQTYVDSVGLTVGADNIATLRLDGAFGFNSEELNILDGQRLLEFKRFLLRSDGSVDLPDWGIPDGWIPLDKMFNGGLAGFPLEVTRARLFTLGKPPASADFDPGDYDWDGERTAYELDLGMRIHLGDMLEAVTGNLGATLGIVIMPPSGNGGWNANLVVHGLEVSVGYPDYFAISGAVNYTTEDLGGQGLAKMFSGTLGVKVAAADIEGTVQVVSPFQGRSCYGWRCSVFARFDADIPIPPTPIGIHGIGGGISYHMVPPGIENIPEGVPDFFSPQWKPDCDQGLGIQAMMAIRLMNMPEDLIQGTVGALLLISPTQFYLNGKVQVLASQVVDLPDNVEDAGVDLGDLCAEAFIGLDFKRPSLDGRGTIGCGPSPHYSVAVGSVDLLHIQGHAGLHAAGDGFFFEVGSKEEPVRAEVLPDWFDVSTDSYFHLGNDAWEAGVGYSAGFGEWDLGFCDVGAKASIAGDAGLYYRRRNVSLSAGVAAKLRVDACVATIKASGDLRLTIPKNPHIIAGSIRVRKKFLFFPTIKFTLPFSSP